MGSKRLAAVLLITILLVTACQRSESTSKRLKVLTTIAPLYCFTLNIADGIVDVENLLPSGADPHGYHLSPEDVRRFMDADILIKNGAGLEPWLKRLISVSGRVPQIVDASRGIKTISTPHGRIEPHIWLSPKNAILQVRNIRDALIEADPQNGRLYENNADEYILRLRTLDNHIRRLLKGSTKGFVASSPAFSYLVRDYALRQISVINESHEQRSSPMHIARIIDTIRLNGIRVVISDSDEPGRTTHMIAEDLDLQLVSLDTLETSPEVVDSSWYEKRLMADINILRGALSE